MSTYFAILTQVGEAKLANAIALGHTLKLKKMGVGDGNGNLPIPVRTQNALVHEVRRADLNQLAVDPTNSSQVVVEQVLPEEVGGWWIREIGIYDEAGDLCAVANCPPSYKPKMAEGSGRTQVVRIVLIVASTAAIELKIDPSVVLATRKYADDQDASTAATLTVSMIKYFDGQMALHLGDPDPHVQYKPKNLVVLNKSVAGSADVTLTDAEARSDVLTFSGRLTANINVLVPARARSWTVKNATTGAFSLTIKTPDGSGLTVAQGCTRVPYCDGGNVLSRISDVGTAEGTTPEQFDNTRRLATTEFVKKSGMQASGIIGVTKSTTLGSDSIGAVVEAYGAGGYTLQLPKVAETTTGGRIELVNYSGGPVTLVCQKPDVFIGTYGSVNSVVLQLGDTLTVYSSGGWMIVGGSASLKGLGIFNALLQRFGYKKEPSGLIEQWGVTTSAANSTTTVALNFAFPNEFFGVISTPQDNVATGAANPTSTALPLTLGTFSLRSYYTASSLAHFWRAFGC